MNKLFALFIIALFTNGAFGQQEEKKNNTGILDDRYGFDGPSWFPNNWSQLPGQNRFPGQNQLPGQNQFPDQNQFPGQNQLPGQSQFPEQNQFPSQNPGQQPPTSTPRTGGSTTLSPAVQQCIASCPGTPEYNPVCGTNNETYQNAGKLSCAQLCGVNVSLLRTSRCPTPAA